LKKVGLFRKLYYIWDKLKIKENMKIGDKLECIENYIHKDGINRNGLK